jgi:FAD/FMN-containing dehydrogenase
MIEAYRRRFLQRSVAFSLLASLGSPAIAATRTDATERKVRFRRARPSDPSWPSSSRWQALNQAVGGRLIRASSPLAACVKSPDSAACAELFRALRNPYYIGDDVGLTQTLGWVDAWTTAPSAYAVAARNAQDVAAAVKFARRHRLRLVVKGGGHSYQGTSNCADSLLVWTRAMNDVTLHDAFVAQDCSAKAAPQPAVSVGSGAIWMHVYDAVTTKGGRYVQGGGCATVGVAGLIQSGGFGSFSKNYGIAAAALLEAEVVTADGAVRVVNACKDPELFWSLKGGGGGSFGVVTRLTLRTRELPQTVGGVFATVKAASEAAYRELIRKFVGFYGDRLFNPRWGETVGFGPRNTMRVNMVFHGIDRNEATEAWRPFFDAVSSASKDFALESAPVIIDLPARHFWDPETLQKLPGAIRSDDRAGAPADNVFWAGDADQVGQFLHGYESVWLPASLLREGGRERFAEALFAGSRHWTIGLHFNKGLAGAPQEEIEAARDTATNPAVLDAFALAIIASEGAPAFPGIAGHEPDVATARKEAAAIGKAMEELRRADGSGSYVSESNYFERDWQQSFWGSNYARLRAAKTRYDPEGLFFVHHGVGTEEWTADGFDRLA